jgi:hypothetical protein
MNSKFIDVFINPKKVYVKEYLDSSPHPARHVVRDYAQNDRKETGIYGLFN